jgi:hypothetical protein
MKKFFVVSMSVLVLLIGDIRVSRGAVGLATQDPVVAIIGAMLSLAGGALLVSAKINPPDITEVRPFRRSGITFLVLGLIILDEENHRAQFMELTESEASRCGISNKNREVYNSELEELNAVLAENSARLASEPHLSASDLVRAGMAQLSQETRQVLSLCF